MIASITRVATTANHEILSNWLKRASSLAGVNPWEEHDALEYDVTRTAIPARVAPEEDAARDVE
jgi:hypothetical protein